MFGRDFYPTPVAVIEQMIAGVDISGKVILEPSAGRGDIVSYMQQLGAKDVIACETHPELRQILGNKCRLIAEDFLTVTAQMVSHVDLIIMNPPFSADEHHLLHAYTVAPPGCQVLALCNSTTLSNPYSAARKQLTVIIEEHGGAQNLGDCFSTADHKTGIDVSLVRLTKDGKNYQHEFSGFFLEADDQGTGEQGVMSYNSIRDLVNRYIEAVKIFDQQLEAAVRLNEMIGTFYRPPSDGRFSTTPFAIMVSQDSRPVARVEFRKDLQKQAWLHVFRLMNMDKYATRGLLQDINKFVEQQTQIPFTMKNIYHMLEIVVGTNTSRMDKALLEVFDNVTRHYDENRYHVEGWKTNSHYLLNEKFILGNITTPGWNGQLDVRYSDWGNANYINDMVKALCWITGTNYDTLEHGTLQRWCSDVKPSWGEWHRWTFFEIRGYKKGTMHFKFIDRDLWAQFNQHIARLKGYPLHEARR